MLMHKPQHILQLFVDHNGFIVFDSAEILQYLTDPPQIDWLQI